MDAEIIPVARSWRPDIKRILEEANIEVDRNRGREDSFWAKDLSPKKLSGLRIALRNIALVC